MKDTIIKNLRLQFPFIAEQAVELQQDDRTSVVAKLDTGEVYLYDDYDRTIRKLPRDSRSMTERECRDEFGIRLRKLMMIKGVTQNELSAMTGITQSALSNYLTGKTTPGFYTVDRIAKVLGCSIDEFRYTK